MTVLVGDCIEVMASMEPESVDAICTDPPYGIGFMGKAWDGKAIAAAAARDFETRQDTGPASAEPDGRLHGRSKSAFGNAATYAGPRDHTKVRGRSASMHAGEYDLRPTANRAFQAWCELWAAEALRVLKPGGHLLAFGGTRTFHRLTAGIEDAGFEIRDCLSWMYGSGFPKSMDVSKAIDKAKGAEGAWRQEDHPGRPGARTRDGAIIGQVNHATSDANPEGLRHIYEAETAEAQQWDGWGTALKPAWEPVVLARKPLKTVAANVLEHGTGALNIAGCRIEASGRPAREVHAQRDDVDYQPNALSGRVDGSLQSSKAVGTTDIGRWPANVMLDQEAAAMLDAQTSHLGSGGDLTGQEPSRPGLNTYGEMSERGAWQAYGDSGGASRFFYCSKTSPAERGAGLPEGMVNDHPTVKPIDVMRWLVRLVTPPGGTVLDPFTGSGTTGCAATLEGFEFVGIEECDGTPDAAGNERPDYVAIAEARIAWWARHEPGVSTAAALVSGKARDVLAEQGQMDLLGG